MTDDEGEFLCDNYRRRKRWMDRMIAPFEAFEALECVAIAVAAAGAIALFVKSL